MKKKKKTHLGPKQCFWRCLGLFLSFCPLLPLHSLTTLQYCCCLWWFAGIGLCQWWLRERSEEEHFGINMQINMDHVIC